MPNAAARLALKSLALRLSSQAAELATCSTAAMTRCVKLAIADTERQIAELSTQAA